MTEINVLRRRACSSGSRSQRDVNVKRCGYEGASPVTCRAPSLALVLKQRLPGHAMASDCIPPAPTIPSCVMISTLIGVGAGAHLAFPCLVCPVVPRSCRSKLWLDVRPRGIRPRRIRPLSRFRAFDRYIYISFFFFFFFTNVISATTRLAIMILNASFSCS